MSRCSPSSPVRLALSYLAFLVFTLFALFPLGETARVVIRSQARPGLTNFSWFNAASEQAGWPTALLALTVAIGGVALASAFGYFFSRLQSRPRSAVLDRSPLLQILPALVLLTPLALVLWKLGLGWSLLWVGVISLIVVLPFCSWQLKRAYDGISPAVEEAAALEGCTTWQKYLSILWPAAAPALGWTAFASFVTAWNVYFVTGVTLGDQALFQIPHAGGFAGRNGNEQWALGVTIGFALALLIGCFLCLLPRTDEPRATADR